MGYFKVLYGRCFRSVYVPTMRGKKRRRPLRVASDAKKVTMGGFNGFHPRRGSRESDGRRRGDEDGENASCSLLFSAFL